MRLSGYFAAAAALAATIAAPLGAQVRTVDPNSAIDADLRPQARGTPPSQTLPPPPPSDEVPVDPGAETLPADSVADAPLPATPAPAAPASTAGDPATATTSAAASPTFKRDDLIGAGEGVFGKGAQGLAELIEKLLKEQGEPNAYIAGREASGAFVVGLRYGSGVMNHKVEGERPVYWTGPSLGFDVGGDANKVFVLVYNLYDSQELYKRYPAAEGRLYFVGGFAATYLRRGNVVLIPIRLGVGWRAGVNVGYMRFSEKSKWLPF